MQKDTALLHRFRQPKDQYRAANMPIVHASTIFFETLEELENCNDRECFRSSYGLHGTETHFSLLDSLVELEGGVDGVLVPSGLTAITLPLMSLAKSGDEVLIPDNCYRPTARFADIELARMGISVRYYAPTLSAAELESILAPSTRVIMMETPGSDTFEMPDVPAIAEMAKRRGIKTLIDNTWSAGYYFQPLKHGVDVSLQALTKYVAGHSDCLLGLVVCAEQEDFQRLYDTHAHHGVGFGGPEVVYLATRGLRSMPARLRQHQDNAMVVAHWLEACPDVTRVLMPALPSDPGYGIWQRDFTGCTSLFSFEIKRRERKYLAKFLDHLELIGMGFSWGGYESLIVPKEPKNMRPASGWDSDDLLLRLHVGLEDPQDIIAELEAGFKRYFA